MREYLYRGKRIDNGEWIYGNLVEYNNPQNNTTNYVIIQNANWILDDCGCREFYEEEMHIVYYKTVGEYTGVKDIKGNKIFGGDIISVKFDADGVPFGNCDWYEEVEVFFSEEFHAWSTKDLVYNKEMDLLYEYDGHCIIIGNIYDNPELLEGRLK